jgi:hypothetical protein
MAEADFDGYLHRQMGVPEMDWDAIHQWMAVWAMAAQMYFESLVAQGFSPEYALGISMAHGVIPKVPPTQGTGNDA